jgi:hypothetical protein
MRWSFRSAKSPRHLRRHLRRPTQRPGDRALPEVETQRRELARRINTGIEVTL